MNSQEHLPLKSLGLWSVFVLCALLTAYWVFVAILSVWVGLTHLRQDGFWMPILVGTASVLLALSLFVRLSRFILNRLREKDTLRF